MTDSHSDSDEYHCKNCAKDLTDPTTCGFLFDGSWWCKPFCAEVAAGFWSRGYELKEGDSKNGAVVATDGGTDKRTKSAGIEALPVLSTDPFLWWWLEDSGPFSEGRA